MRLFRLLLIAALVLALPAGIAYAQLGFGLGFRSAARLAPAEMPDRGFVVCRVMYQSVRSEPSGAGWRTDYPLGEINLSIRLSELTRTPVSMDYSDRPNCWVVRLTDDQLFECPFTMASDVGTMYLSPDEAARLREYLLKGGFLWVDDFWGTVAWEQWSREIAKVLPPAEYPIEDIPLDDPIFSAQFQVDRFPQISNIRYWRQTLGSDTSERGPDSAVPHFRAIRDSRERIMVVMSHNTDIADAWEREGEDPRCFYQFSPDGYAVGINVLLHAMTH
jgi:hypothetical protein